MNMDVTALVTEKRLLQTENNVLRMELDQMRSKYQNLIELEVREKERLSEERLLDRKALEDMRRDNQGLREKNDLLKKQIEDLQNKIDAHVSETSNVKQELKDVKATMHTIKNEMLNTRKKLLLGSVAYNFIDCAVRYIFPSGEYKSRRKALRTIQDIEEAKKTDGEEGKWEKFKENYWNEEYDEVLEKFTGNRLEIAHPTTLHDDDEDSPNPAALQSYVKDLYRNKSSEPFRGHACLLIDSLDQLARALRRPMLQ
jgi:hypothetical protein